MRERQGLEREGKKESENKRREREKEREIEKERTLQNLVLTCPKDISVLKLQDFIFHIWPSCIKYQ